MPYYFFIWTPEIEQHLGEHGIDVSEFENVVQHPQWIEPSRSSSRTIAFGEINGRQIACVYEQFGD